MTLKRRLETMERFQRGLELEREVRNLTDAELLSVINEADPDVVAWLLSLSPPQRLRLVNGKAVEDGGSKWQEI